MDAAAGNPGGAAPQHSSARRPSETSRSSSVSVVAAGDGPETAASPPPHEGSGDESAAHYRDSQDVESAAASVKSDDPVKPEGSVEPSDASAPSASVPVQKRRRVTRACDECRRKKIKCDGRSPCTHCSVYSYECTYDKPSNRRRNPAPQYIEALENRLQRAENLLRKFMPDLDLVDPKLDPTVQQEFANRERARAQAAKSKKEDSAPQPGSSQTHDDQLMSMIESIGHLDLIDGNEWDFHGNSSGAVFLRRLKEQMGLYNQDNKVPFLPRRPRPPGMLSLDSPQSSASSPFDSTNEGTAPAIYDLPPKEVARSLCYYSLNCATCLLRIVHIPSFNESFDRLYDKGPENLGPDDHRPLALLYSVMALGCMYASSEEDDTSKQVHYNVATEKGLKYYTIARVLLQDITECRDLVSLQALLFMIMFLQATSNLSGCYAFLGIALRAALRMGLHRHLPHVQLTPIEDESRRRVFYTIRQMDIYVSALLGFPILLRDGDIDQPLPTEVDDEYITKDAVLTPPPGTPSFFQAMNAHVGLMRILGKVIKEIYPLRGIEDCAAKGDQSIATYMISYSSIKQIERELHQWYEELPITWRPSPEGPIEVIRVRYLLRFSYAHVQMMLYRPFLHYVSPRLSAGKPVDERYYACAAACISISRNIIHIGMEIRKQAALVGPYWFILYTEFFAILSLTFYALENPDKPGTPEILADAHAGREVIASLSKRSLAADRVTDALNTLFEQLPDRVNNLGDQAQKRPMATKKRAAPGAEASPSPIQGQKSTPGNQRFEDSSRLQSVRGRGRGRGTGRAVSEAQLDRRAQRMSVEAAQHVGGRSSQAFMSSFSDPVPLDMLVGPSHSPESAAGGYQRPPSGFQQVQQRGPNQIYKLDAMMFPSGDPFAYPSQPMVDLSHGPPREGSGHGGVAGPPHPDSMQFYMNHGYDDIEGQLLGPIPSYLMQPAQGPGLDDLAAQMYNASSMISLQQAQRHAMGPGGPHMGPGQQQPHHHHHHHQNQQHQQELDQMLMTDPNSFNMFPHQYRQL